MHAVLAERRHHGRVVPAGERVVEVWLLFQRVTQVTERPSLDDGHRVLHDRTGLEQGQQSARGRTGTIAYSPP